jgi:hypothetical protein
VDDLDRRLTRLEDRVTNLAAGLEDLEREVVTGDGPGGRRSIRTRLHDLEGAQAAKSAAESALSAVKAEKRATNTEGIARRMYLLALLNFLLVLAAATGHLHG